MRGRICPRSLPGLQTATLFAVSSGNLPFACTCVCYFSLCDQISSYNTSHIGFGPTLLQYDLLLINYICKDSISVDPVPNSWRVGRGHIFRGQEGTLTTPAESFCHARSHIHGLLERSVDHYLAPPHGPALMELTVPGQLTPAPEVGGTEATICRVCTGVWVTC